MILKMSELNLVFRKDEVSGITALVSDLLLDTNCDVAINHHHESGQDLVTLTIEFACANVLEGVAKYLRELEEV